MFEINDTYKGCPKTAKTSGVIKLIEDIARGNVAEKVKLFCIQFKF